MIWSGAAVLVVPAHRRLRLRARPAGRARAGVRRHDREATSPGSTLAGDSASLLGDGLVSCVHRFDRPPTSGPAPCWSPPTTTRSASRSTRCRTPPATPPTVRCSSTAWGRRPRRRRAVRGPRGVRRRGGDTGGLLALVGRTARLSGSWPGSTSWRRPAPRNRPARSPTTPPTSASSSAGSGWRCSAWPGWRQSPARVGRAGRAAERGGGRATMRSAMMVLRRLALVAALLALALGLGNREAAGAAAAPGARRAGGDRP